MMFRVVVIKKINMKIVMIIRKIIKEIIREIKWYLEDDDCYLKIGFKMMMLNLSLMIMEIKMKILKIGVEKWEGEAIAK